MITQELTDHDIIWTLLLSHTEGGWNNHSYYQDNAGRSRRFRRLGRVVLAMSLELKQEYRDYVAAAMQGGTYPIETLWEGVDDD